MAVEATPSVAAMDPTVNNAAIADIRCSCSIESASESHIQLMLAKHVYVGGTAWNLEGADHSSPACLQKDADTFSSLSVNQKDSLLDHQPVGFDVACEVVGAIGARSRVSGYLMRTTSAKGELTLAVQSALTLKCRPDVGGILRVMCFYQDSRIDLQSMLRSIGVSSSEAVFRLNNCTTVKRKRSVTSWARDLLGLPQHKQREPKLSHADNTLLMQTEGIRRRWDIRYVKELYGSSDSTTTLPDSTVAPARFNSFVAPETSSLTFNCLPFASAADSMDNPCAIDSEVLGKSSPVFNTPLCGREDAGRRALYATEKKLPQILWMLNQLQNILSAIPKRRWYRHDGHSESLAGSELVDQSSSFSLSSHSEDTMDPRDGPYEAHVVDVGGGRGDLAIAAAKAFGGVWFTVIDMNRLSLDTGRARAVKLGLDNVEFICKSLTDLVLPAKGVDVVMSLHACGGLTDGILHHGFLGWQTRALLVCTCCFGKHPHLRAKYLDSIVSANLETYRRCCSACPALFSSFPVCDPPAEEPSSLPSLETSLKHGVHSYHTAATGQPAVALAGCSTAPPPTTSTVSPQPAVSTCALNYSPSESSSQRSLTFTFDCWQLYREWFALTGASSSKESSGHRCKRKRRHGVSVGESEERASATTGASRTTVSGGHRYTRRHQSEERASDTDDEPSNNQMSNDLAGCGEDDDDDQLTKGDTEDTGGCSKKNNSVEVEERPPNDLFIVMPRRPDVSAVLTSLCR
eukprot:GHVQ01011451.1.p1 GENE.GHVQ01011451.1~~GHVQ01011451.1.p1  ORF type:complete len:819 (-),score=100.07 GHVQ01011451.1:3977-6211(-)